MPETALELSGVSAGYGDTVVLNKVSLAVRAGECIAIIGRNGVGKTTLLASIVGRARLHGGTVRLFGRDIARLPGNRRAAAGLGLVPQEREIFASLTVRENLLVARRPGPWTFAGVCALFPRLAERLDHRGNQLSGGEQQMLAIARALMGNPSVLLLDEPTEGLAPVIVEHLMAAVERLSSQEGLTLLMVEQNARLALQFAPRAVVLESGSIAFDGASAELMSNEGLLTTLVGLDGGRGGVRRPQHKRPGQG
jgi:branched-chain amino acid transport system ATP-binding protein